MVALSNAIPPTPPLHDIDALMSLIELLADPAAAKKRVKEFGDAADNARQAIEQLNKDQAAVLQLKLNAQTELSAATRAHEQRISDELEQHRAAMAAEHDEIAASKARAAKDEEAAATASAKAKMLQEKLERRLKVLQEP